MCLRAALALAVNALLSMRAGLVVGQPLLVTVGVVLFAASGAAVVIGQPHPVRTLGERVQHAERETARAAEVVA